MEEVLEGKDFSFAGQEERILKLWEAIDAFRNQLRRTEGKPEYIFYDGPPFATGLPHYGHLLAGTIKDIVTRFQTAIGHHVTRRFGWDCHGLPVEYEIDQKLGTRTKEDVLKFGIANYNEECRKIVMRYSKEWETIVTRMGRWIDFENDYKTLDPEFMESVWWVFKQLFDKSLVYKGFKVMPYSTGCNTPLSNFEAGQNYKDVSDPAVVVSFPLMDEPGNPAMVAWTTTPWTLPSNLALCVNAGFTYLKVKCVTTGSVYIIAESRLAELPSKKSKEAAASSYEVIGTFKGQELVGKRYKPLFEYFMELSSVAFKVVADSYVTNDSGTGIVHCAPAFGEDDYRVCLQAGIIQKGENLPNPVDMNGCFTEKVTDFKSRYVKEADKDIIAAVKGMGRLVSMGNIVHSYPFCWRSDTPLIYKAVPSWFVAVEKIKDRLLECNKQTYWVPDFVKEKRFHNWLENSRDWAISRSRYWGTPLPIWISDDGLEIVVIGSIEELERYSGAKVTDLHRHYIDDLVIPSRRGPEYGVLKRVEEVFDCWFESGSMPYGYIHYPFENQELFDRNFPGHFVAEGLDQTRGWFYTLMVLSTALFDKPAFRNLICNGLVLAEDGKKMSKRLKNYPSPMVVVDEYGADALRLYLINSPVVRAEPLRFKKEGVHAVVKDVFLPWYNAYRFLVQNALRLNLEGLQPFLPLDATTMESSTNVLDQWINSASHSLVQFVKKEMEAYRLYTVVPSLLKFIDNLTNIYVRFNRKRLKGRTGEADCRVALSTLFTVLLTVCKMMAPLTPFFTEVLYQNLRRVLGPIAEESVHYCSFPEVGGKTDQRIEKSVARMVTVIDLARIIRERHNKPLKTPLREMIIVHPDEGFLQDITGKLGEYVQEEINVRSIVPCNDPLKFASLRAEPDFSLLGKKLGRAMGSVAKEVKAMDQASILAFEKNGTGHFAGHQLVSGEIKVIRDFKPPDGVCKEDIDASGDGDVLVILDLRPDQSLMEAGIAREVVNRIQKLRKKAGLEPTDAVEVYIQVLDEDEKASSALKQAVVSQASYIREAVGSLLPQTVLPLHAVELASQKFEGVGGGDFKVTICRATLSFDEHALLEACSGEPQHALFVKTVLLARDLAKLRSELASNKQRAELAIAGVGKFTIIQGKHFYLSVGDHYATGLLSL